MTPVTYETLCAKHGRQDATVKSYKHQCVAVGAPHTRKERKDGGCPICKKEANEQALKK